MYKQAVPERVLRLVASGKVWVLSVLFGAKVRFNLVEFDDRSYLPAVVQEVEQLLAETRELFDVVLIL